MRVIQNSFFVLSLLVVSASAHADPRDQYGWGLHDLATAGSDRTGSDDGMTVVQNPASLVNQTKSVWSANLVGMNFQFPDVNGVVLDDVNLGASSPTVGSVAVTPDPLYLLQAGISTPFGADKKWRFGFALSIPVDRMVDLETLNGYQPIMAFYGKPEARLTSVIGLARQLNDTISVGLGAQLYFTTGATLAIRLPQAPSTSTLAFGATVRLALAPQVGVDFKISRPLEINLGYLGARDYRQQVSATNLLYLLGPGTAGVLQLGTTGSDFYDPEVYSLGAKYDLGSSENQPGTQILFGVDLERWSPYDGTVAKITFSSFTTQFVQNPNNLSFRDIIVPRASIVFGEHIRWRAGYAYRPSPVVDLNGATNEMDANRHVLGAGASFDIGTLGVFETPAKMDVGAQVQYLSPRTVQKQDPTAVGAPGYTVSGMAYFYGLGLSHDI